MLEDLKMEKSTNKKKRSQTDNDVQNYKQHGSDNSENHFTKPTRKSRHVQNHSYAIPSATKDFRIWSFVVNTVKDWNNLPPDIATAKSLESFKAQVAKLFE
jgi:leucyl aminopeptidase